MYYEERNGFRIGDLVRVPVGEWEHDAYITDLWDDEVVVQGAPTDDFSRQRRGVYSYERIRRVDQLTGLKLREEAAS